MLFNSHVFIFFFCPIVFSVFFLLARKNFRLGLAWLTASSLFFYSWWNPPYIFLLLGSVIFNYLVGIWLNRYPDRKKPILIVGVTSNLLLLGYYKYTNFLIDTWNTLSGSSVHLASIILPLAISFHTFQQIAYLVDTYRGETKHYRFSDYLFFVVFFPQLIAGPIVKHDEIIPQISGKTSFQFEWWHVCLGLTIFSFGLFKKVVLADYVSVVSDHVFGLSTTTPLSFTEAWLGALAYALQIYFDFSGYSDMAIGLALIVGIRFPMNFFSPYQANNIIDFWRRWHMTLSRFLRDYLYIPLGGNRNGPVRRHANLMITMLLGGLWHGAGWTFVIWGGLHGAYLAINHAWRHLGISRRWESNLVWEMASRLLTFGAVCFAWVFFRSTSFSGALELISSMFGFNGFHATFGHIGSARDYVYFVFWALVFVFFAPNVYVWMERFQPVLSHGFSLRFRVPDWLEWRPAALWAVASAATFLMAVLLINKDSPFLYFQF
ncbi:MAG: MBOAT family protein [Deltaproteobacteria bacterium]|nr:MBOAT family protein [Deltaproteobacteria bacterium]